MNAPSTYFLAMAGGWHPILKLLVCVLVFMGTGALCGFIVRGFDAEEIGRYVRLGRSRSARPMGRVGLFGILFLLVTISVVLAGAGLEFAPVNEYRRLLLGLAIFLFFAGSMWDYWKEDF